MDICPHCNNPNNWSQHHRYRRCECDTTPTFDMWSDERNNALLNEVRDA